MPLIEKELIFVKRNFKDNIEALSFLADQLKEKQKVKPTFKEKVLFREENYPTALSNDKLAVTIPHANWQEVRQSALAIATLNKPVIFKNITKPKQDLKVQIIIMLAISQPKAEVKMLQKLTFLVQNQKYLSNLLAYKRPEGLSKYIKQILGF